MNKIFKIRTVALLVLAMTLALNISVQAQTEDTSAAPTAPIDNTQPADAVTSPGALDTAATPTTSTLIDTSVPERPAPAAQEAESAPVWRSAWYHILLFLVACIFIGIIGKVLRVYELSREMQGKPGALNWNKIQGGLFLVMLILGLAATYWTYDVWGGMSMNEAASVHGERIDFMMAITIAITTLVFVLTHILLFGFSFKYKGSSHRKAYFYPHNNALERLWTIIPAIVLTILVLLGFFTWRSITNVSEEDQKKALSVEVVGEQFKWTIRYAGSDNALGLRNYKLTTPSNSLGIDFKDSKSWDDKIAGEIVLPVNRPVRFTIGSKDILHSFYIPDFRVQMNAVPGMPTYFQFTPKYTTEEMREKTSNPKFNYVLLCNKICGAGHYNMQSNVRVVTEKEYNEWLAEQALFYNDDMKKQFPMVSVKPEIESLAVNQ
ncbi:MAG TPA: cytochrome c oxidase subunit II transmembrane domain-containing protein [Sphingobacteriaceae bacterium]